MGRLDHNSSNGKLRIMGLVYFYRRGNRGNWSEPLRKIKNLCAEQLFPYRNRFNEYNLI